MLQRYAHGFTLIELMITVAIIGILVSIAYPSYMDSVRKTRRVEAQTQLLAGMQAQERFYTENNTYTTVVLATSGCVGAACGLNYSSATSAEGHYTLSAAAGPTGSIATSVTLTATLGTSSLDTQCGNLTLTSQGVKGSSIGTASKCWNS